MDEPVDFEVSNGSSRFKGGVGMFFPLDAAGNGVRGRRVVRFLSEVTELYLFGS